MYNSSVKFFDNRENENEESYYSTLASEITTFTQQQLNIAGSGTTNIGNVYANNYILFRIISDRSKSTQNKHDN